MREIALVLLDFPQKILEALLKCVCFKTPNKEFNHHYYKTANLSKYLLEQNNINDRYYTCTIGKKFGILPINIKHQYFTSTNWNELHIVSLFICIIIITLLPIGSKILKLKIKLHIVSHCHCLLFCSSTEQKHIPNYKYSIV